ERVLVPARQVGGVRKEYVIDEELGDPRPSLLGRREVEGCFARLDCGRHPHGEPSSEPRVDRLALQRQNAEHALVYAVERLLLHKSVQRLQSESELAERQGPFWSKASCAK